MEGLKKRTWLAAGLVLVAGIVVAATPQASAAKPRTERWMLESSPLRIGEFRALPSMDSNLYSYKMDPTTYEVLQPYGIVARQFQSGGKAYDVVLIASNKKSSFHDPRVCFTAQGWNLQEQRTRMVEVPGRGEVPVTMAKTLSPDKREQVAAFFYQSDGRFFATPQQMTMHLLLEQLKGRANLEGVFYRFIPQHQGATEDELAAFIADYLQEANRVSGGFF